MNDQTIDIDLSSADITHIRVGDGCVISVNGQGHLPCTEHDYTASPMYASPMYDALVAEQEFEPRDVPKHDPMGAKIRHHQWLNEMRDRVEAKMAKKRKKR